MDSLFKGSIQYCIDLVSKTKLKNPQIHKYSPKIHIKWRKSGIPDTKESLIFVIQVNLMNRTQVLHSISIVFCCFLSLQISAQFVGPGCYCLDGALFTADATVSSLPIGSVGSRYSTLPCQAAFAQADGTNCVACACTDEFNDNAIDMIQDKALFEETATPGTYTMVACADVIESDEELLFCGPCPFSQVGNACDTFVAPGPDTDPTVAQTVPTMGEWAIISLGILLLIISISSFKSVVYRKAQI